jgi:hypothetical protein
VLVSASRSEVSKTVPAPLGVSKVCSLLALALVKTPSRLPLPTQIGPTIGLYIYAVAILELPFVPFKRFSPCQNFRKNTRKVVKNCQKRHGL